MCAFERSKKGMEFFMAVKNYDRNLVISYAKRWALSRNPKYYNFDAVGGDCTSFIS